MHEMALAQGVIDVIESYAARERFAAVKTVWLEIGVIHKLARTDSCAVDHEIEFSVDIFELLEADVRVHFAAALAKARGEVVEINRSVHQRDAK